MCIADVVALLPNCANLSLGGDKMGKQDDVLILQSTEMRKFCKSFSLSREEYLGHLVGSISNLIWCQRTGMLEVVHFVYCSISAQSIHAI